MSEADLAANVSALAKALKWRGYHTHRSDHSERGFPDWVFLRGGCMIVAELKAQKGYLGPAQREWLQEFSQVSGCRAYVWRPSDWLAGKVAEALAWQS